MQCPISTVPGMQDAMKVKNPGLEVKINKMIDTEEKKPKQRQLR